ncbi:MAG: hypothetical protein WEE64_13485 [Dehalococcoidia bacterium]
MGLFRKKVSDDAWKQAVSITADAIREIGDVFEATGGAVGNDPLLGWATVADDLAWLDGLEAQFKAAKGAYDNAGEPVAEDEDLFGTAVQLARRICDEARSGEILASNVVRELAAGKGFLFADRGASALKGFEDPVRLYEVRWPEP